MVYNPYEDSFKKEQLKNKIKKQEGNLSISDKKKIKDSYNKGDLKTADNISSQQSQREVLDSGIDIDARPYLESASKQIKEQREKELKKANEQLKKKQQEAKGKSQPTITKSPVVDSSVRDAYSKTDSQIKELEKQLNSGKATSDQIKRINNTLDTLKGKQKYREEETKKKAMIPLNNYLETINSPHTSEQGKLKAKALYNKEVQRLQKIYGSDISEEVNKEVNTLTVEPTTETKTEDKAEDKVTTTEPTTESTNTEPTTETKVDTGTTTTSTDTTTPEIKTEDKVEEPETDTTKIETVKDLEKSTKTIEEKTEDKVKDTATKAEEELLAAEAKKKAARDEAAEESKEIIAERDAGQLERVSESEERLKQTQEDYEESIDESKERVKKSLAEQVTEIGRSGAAAAAAAGRSGVRLPEGELQSLRAAFSSKYSSDVAGARDTYERNMQALDEKIKENRLTIDGKQRILDQVKDIHDDDMFAMTMDALEKGLAGDEQAFDDAKNILKTYRETQAKEQSGRALRLQRIEDERQNFSEMSITDKSDYLRDVTNSIEGIETVDIERIVNANPDMTPKQLRAIAEKYAAESSDRKIKLNTLLQKNYADMSTAEKREYDALMGEFTKTREQEVTEEEVIEESKKAKETDVKQEEKTQLSQKETVEKIIKEKESNPKAYAQLLERLKTNPRFKDQMKQLFNK